mgnify:CR=1 FL=1
MAYYKTKYNRLRRKSTQTKIKTTPLEDLSPDTRVSEIMNNTDSATVRKRLLFGEAISDQLKLNYGKVDNNKEKQQFRKILEGKIVRKYRIKKQIRKILKGRLWTTKDNFNNKNF